MSKSTVRGMAKAGGKWLGVLPPLFSLVFGLRIGADRAGTAYAGADAWPVRGRVRGEDAATKARQAG
jgi:hypothetical protein